MATDSDRARNKEGQVAATARPDTASGAEWTSEPPEHRWDADPPLARGVKDGDGDAEQQVAR